MKRSTGPTRTTLPELALACLISLWVGGVHAESYRYDAAGRLIAVSYDDGSSISYSYDANGNLLSRITEAAKALLLDDDEFLWDARIQSPTAGLLEAEQAQLYRAYYGAMGRLPDRGGYQWWLNEIREGRHTLESMAAGFIRSPEFRGYADTDLDGSISNAELITHMYLNVFGRPPDAEGFAWWVGQLDSGAKTQARAFILMTQSNEYVKGTLEAVAAFAFL